MSIAFLFIQQVDQSLTFSGSLTAKLNGNRQKNWHENGYKNNVKLGRLSFALKRRLLSPKKRQVAIYFLLSIYSSDKGEYSTFSSVAKSG